MKITRKFFLFSSFLLLISLSFQILFDQYLKPQLVFCDVGQGDAIFFQFFNFQMIIDSGKSEELFMKCVETHILPFDKTIEVVVATHPDYDHIGAFLPLLQSYQIENFFLLPFSKETDFFREFEKKLESNLIDSSVKNLIFNISSSKFILSDTTSISFWNNYNDISSIPDRIKTERYSLELSDKKIFIDQNNIDHNDLSIVTFLEINDQLVLLMGDLEKDGELALVATGLLRPVSLLKVGHHGAKTSSSEEFLSLVRPEKSVISVGAKNSYGHPTNETLKALENVDSEVFRTDELGTIKFVFSGNKWLRCKNILFNFCSVNE